MSIPARAADPEVAPYAPPAREPAGGAEAAERAAGVVTLSIWMALAGALAQLALLAVNVWGRGRMSESNPHIVWMAPALLLMLLVPPGLALALVARRWPRLARWDLVATAFGFVAALNLALYSTSLHKVAILILAAGIAVQLGRWAGGRPARFVAMARRSIPWMAGLFALLGAGVAAYPVVLERRAVAALPPAARGAPNVLLLILDTVRASSTSLHGHVRRTTPGLEALARRGVAFDWAMATAPWTLPTHASIFTGRWAHELSTAWDSPLDDAHPTLAEALAARGYATAAFAANPFYTTREFGLARGFARFEDFSWKVGEVAHAAPLVETIANRPQLRRLTGFHDVLGRKSAPMVMDRLLEWLDGRERGRPWFAFLNLYDAHDPYLPRAPFDTLYGPVEARGNERMRHYGREGSRTDKERLPTATIEALRAGYEGAIAQLDHDIAAMLDSLDARGLLDSTIVIVTSDHGESFGEHGDFEHGKTPYLPQIHAPLVVSWPGHVPEGVRVAQPVSVRDIAATVMSLVAGADTTFPGVSLARYWSGAPVAEEAVLADLAKESAEERARPTSPRRVLSLVQGRWHYLRLRDGGERLFDYLADPDEEHDLAADPAHRATLGAMRAATDALRGSQPAR